MKLLKIYAGIAGFTGVALGAFGAHALKERLEAAKMLSVWETAVHYHLIHAVALLALSAWLCHSQDAKSKILHVAANTWAAGIILFSGSLYILALGLPRKLGIITPIGGVCFLIGWGCIAASAFRKNPK